MSDGEGLVKDVLRDGGSLTVSGPPAAVRVLVAAAHRDLAEGERRRLLELDLEGWEPAAPDLHDFARYRACLENADPNAEDGPVNRLGAGHGVFQAALISLLSGSHGSTLTAASTEEKADRSVFLRQLRSWAEADRLAVITADGDLLPRPLRRALRDAVAASNLTWIDGTGAAQGAVTASLPSADLDHGHRLTRARTEPDGSDERVHRAAWQALEALLLIGLPIDAQALLAALERRGLLEGPEENEALIDRLDDLFADELELVEDLGFLHPAFEGSTYRAKDDAAASQLRRDLDGDLPERAGRWLEDLRAVLPLRRRSTSALLLRCAELALGAEHPRCTHLRRRLDWWLEAGALEPDLADSLREGEIRHPDLEALAGDRVLPVEVRRAVIDTLETVGVSPQREGAHFLAKAQVMEELGLVEEALGAVGRSLEWSLLNHGRHSEPFLAARVVGARLMAEIGELTRARDELTGCRELAAEVLAEDDPRHIGLATELGEICVRIGELRAARRPLEQAVELARRIHGENHVSTLVQRNNLASLLIDVGELEAADALLRGALAAAEGSPAQRQLGPALFHNLLSVMLRLSPQEISALEELLEEGHRLFGEHPVLIPLLSQLGEALREQGDPAGAAPYFERVTRLTDRFPPAGEAELAGLLGPSLGPGARLGEGPGG